jgi:hypothetical protein
MRFQSWIPALVLLAAGTSAPPAPFAQVRSRIGTNLSAPTDYSTQFAFLDAFKSSSPWVSGRMVPRLAAGARKTLTLLALVPRGACPPGSHVLAILDEAGSVAEADEENNVVVWQMR